MENVREVIGTGCRVFRDKLRAIRRVTLQTWLLWNAETQHFASLLKQTLYSTQLEHVRGLRLVCKHVVHAVCS